MTGPWIAFCLLIAWFGVASTAPIEGEMIRMLNGMQELMTGSEKFSSEVYSKLQECFDRFDVDLAKVSDASWAGLKQYAESRGSPNDPWSAKSINMWKEENLTMQNYGHIPVHEPCNYASNIAYYHTAIEICKRKAWSFSPEHVTALFRSFVYLAVGSSFFHSSQTDVGATADVRINDLFPFVVHQATVETLEHTNSSILHDLKRVPRPRSAIEMTNDLKSMFISLPVSEWGKAEWQLSISSINLAMCSTITTAMSLLTDAETLNSRVEWIMDLIKERSNNEEREICSDYAKIIANATAFIDLSDAERSRLRSSLIGTLTKLGYAFVWQEQFAPPSLNSYLIFTSTFNRLGTWMLPYVNSMVNWLFVDFEYHNPNLQRGSGIYPGEEWCNNRVPHAKWHLQTGIALVDYVFLMDQVNGIIKEAQRRETSLERPR